MEIVSSEPVLQSGELFVFGFIVEIEWIVTTLISTCALLFAGWSLFISHRAIKLAQESVEPIISAVLDEIPELPNWLVIRIGLTNRADYTLEAETLYVVKPSGALLLEHNDAHQDDAYGGHALKSELPVELGKTEIKMHLRAARAGSKYIGHPSGPIYGKSDHESQRVYLYVPPVTRSKTLVLRISLISPEAKQRRKTIEIQRNLPEHLIASG